MLTIKPVTETSSTKTPQSYNDPAAKIFKAMSPGRILNVEVAQGGKGSVLLKWGNSQFRAESQIPLREGQNLNLVVTENSSQIKLKILGNSSPVFLSCWPLLTEKNLLARLLDAVLPQPKLLEKPLVVMAPLSAPAAKLFRSFSTGRTISSHAGYEVSVRGRW